MMLNGASDVVLVIILLFHFVFPVFPSQSLSLRGTASVLDQVCLEVDAQILGRA